MDPYNERRLINEVIYLHHLWHQGPPRQHQNLQLVNHNPSTNPHKHNPAPQAEPAASNNLHVSNTAVFKKPKRSKKKRKLPKPTLPPDSGIEWPCSQPASKNPLLEAGWQMPSIASATEPLSGEQIATFAPSKMQNGVIQLCREFYAKRRDEEDDIEDDESENEVDVQECAEYKFFMHLFVENSELRGYYEKNFESADFVCLVCGGVSEKNQKKFKSCAALAQHCAKFLKKNKQGHRALGQVICRVLGWDFIRLPTIVPKNEPLSQTLMNVGESKVESEVNADG